MNKASDKISGKIKRKFKKTKNDRIVNISELKSVKGRLSDIESCLQNILKKEENDPSHKIYIMAQNLLSYFSEDFSTLVEFIDYYDKAVEIEDEFLPAGPPMSPLTKTYFTFWCFCDLMFGEGKETICSIFHDLGVESEFDETILQAISNLNSSYMGFYSHMGFEDDFIILNEIITNKSFRCICPSGYKGKKDEVWYLRIVPNLDQVYSYYIAINTPYIILNYTARDWIDFFQRQGIKSKDGESEKKLYSFLKDNSDFKYWHNYIMDAYVNYTKSHILPRFRMVFRINLSFCRHRRSSSALLKEKNQIADGKMAKLLSQSMKFIFSRSNI